MTKPRLVITGDKLPNEQILQGLESVASIVDIYIADNSKRPRGYNEGAYLDQVVRGYAPIGFPRDTFQNTHEGGCRLYVGIGSGSLATRGKLIAEQAGIPSLAIQTDRMTSSHDLKVGVSDVRRLRDVELGF